MCTLAPAKAHQVQIGVEQGVDVQSNAFGSRVSPVTDGRYRLIPVVTLEQPDSDFTYFLRYRPIYSGYFRSDGINGVDHQIRATSSYQFDARDIIRLESNFFRARGIRSNTFTDAAGQLDSIPTLAGTTQRFDAELSLDHAFSSRTTGTMGVRYNRWDYSDSSNVDNQGYGARLQLTHAPTARWSVGANVDGRYRTFDETGLSPASFSTVINANLIAEIQLTDRLSFEASGGPAGVFSRQSEPGPRLVSRWSPVLFDPVLCPVGPCGRLWGPDPAMTSNCTLSTFGIPVLEGCRLTAGPVTTVPGFPDDIVAVSVDPAQNVFGRSDESLTYFVSVRVVQRLRTGQIEASFTRNEDAVAGIGSSTIVNLGRVGFSYTPSDYWTFQAYGTYSVRESVSRLPTTQVSARASAETVTPGGAFLAEAGPIVAGFALRDFRQEIGIAEASLLRRLSDHSRLRFMFQYYNQTSAAPGFGGEVGLDRFTGGIFYVYEFDPYKF